MFIVNALVYVVDIQQYKIELIDNCLCSNTLQFCQLGHTKLAYEALTPC